MDRKLLVVDSSVLKPLNRRGTLEDYLRRKRDEGFEVIIPRAIARELIQEPRKYAEDIRKRHPELAARIMESVEKVNAAIEHGLIRIETVNYQKYSRTMDNIRKHLSGLDAKPEHTVKKGDIELIALVIQLYDNSNEKILVSTKDKGLLRTLKPFNKKSRIRDRERLDHSNTQKKPEPSRSQPPTSSQNRNQT